MAGVSKLFRLGGRGRIPECDGGIHGFQGVIVPMFTQLLKRIMNRHVADMEEPGKRHNGGQADKMPGADAIGVQHPLQAD